MRRLCCCALFALAPACGADGDLPTSAPDEAGLAAATADLPDTDIFLADLLIETGGVAIENLRPVVEGPGYANQPMFEPGGASFLFTRQGRTGKTDLWRHDMETGAAARVTDTPDRSEFSPKQSPRGGVSWIQETPDGEMTRVFEDGAAVVDFAPVGYYAWLDASPFVVGDALGVFYRSDPPTLHFVNVEAGENRQVADIVGRTLQASPNARALYFSTGDAAGRHTLKRMTFIAGYVTEELIALPPETEDFYVIHDAEGDAKGVFSVDGMQIVYHPFSMTGDAAWAVVATVADLGAPSRIAVSDDHRQLAVVLSAAE